LFVEKRRIVISTIPQRPIGVPIQYQGIYWMRRCEELVSMNPDMLKRIFNEDEPDFSAQIKFEDLDIKVFRDMWLRKSGNHNLKSQLLK
jgi:hypothetical protein